MAELQGKAKQVNVCTIEGRVDFVSNANGVFYSVVMLPAPDSYSRPAAVSVKSRNQIGQPGQEITIDCRVDGFSKSFRRKDNTEGREVSNHFIPLGD